MNVRTHYIKVNIPDSIMSHGSGNGEGCWVLVDDETKQAHDQDVEGGPYSGTLDNDSFYFPAITHGADIEFEMRGEHRPVASLAWLASMGIVLR